MSFIDSIPDRLLSCVVFRDVARGDVLSSLSRFICESKSETAKIEKYSDFVHQLFKHSFSLSDYLIEAISENENFYVKLCAKGEQIPDCVSNDVENELDFFSKLTAIDPAKIKSRIEYDGWLPDFYNSATDIAQFYKNRVANIHKTGYGIYANNTMFCLQDGRIMPVKSADRTLFADLIGYEEERRQVLENTQALLSGKPAANMLLVGDAGTGKSSTVKAVANQLSCEGVRLIELRKEQVLSLPAVMDDLSDNPLKFIIFIDDLSFNKSDDCFSMLKAILEGSASARSTNSVIYATSNRRHLVKESFDDRAGDDVHINDTLQELLSLSERFGKTVLFSRPGKKLYLQIVRSLAERKGICIDADKLDREAEAFALKKGGRSARAAEQFTDSLLEKQ